MALDPTMASKYFLRGEKIGGGLEK